MNTSSRKRNRFFFLLVVAFLGCCAVLAFSSCSKKASAAIIGKWQVQGQKDKVEFRKDGTVITSNGTTSEPPGKYAFTDGSHMSLQIITGNTNEPEISIRCEVHIHGDKMDMTMTVPGQGRQQKAHFTRLK
jgi:hypothetical protein